MNKDVDQTQGAPQEALSSSQEATVDLISSVQAITKARAVYPEGLQAQQRHFAHTLPAAEEALQELLTDQLGGPECWALIDALCAIEGVLPPQELDDCNDPHDVVRL